MSKRNLDGAWAIGDPKELAQNLKNTKWAATSKGWIARPGQKDFPEYWIKVFSGRVSFLWTTKGTMRPAKWDYTNPEEIGILLMQIVFNNSQNIRRVKKS